MNYSISIILPILNEFNSLKKTIEILNMIQVEKEFIVILSKNLTTKKTKENIIKLKKKFKKIKYYEQTRPCVGGAINTGIKKCSKKYIAIMASDLETNPSELNKMINLSMKNSDCIISADRWIVKNGFKNYGLIKFLANFAFQKLIKFFYNYKISDFTFAYRIYPKNSLKNYKIEELRHGFALEILLYPIKQGYRVISTPSKWRKREEGISSITFLSYISYLKVFWKFL